jgi:hypothetical protein
VSDGRSTDTRDALLQSALSCAVRGWHVFPCAAGGKRPALRGKDWRDLSTTDPAQIRGWWATRAFNIGIDCARSGLTVLDLDVPGHGKQAPGEVPDRRTGIGTLFRLCALQGQPLPATGFAVATPSGGYHLYFTACESTVGSSVERLGRLIDVRGAGGYVMAPGSCFEGRYYTLVNPGPLAPFPAWLAQLHEKPDLPACSPTRNPLARVQNDDAYAWAALTGEAGNVAAARTYPDFALNRAAFKLGQLVGAGLLAEGEVSRELAAAAAGSGLTARQIGQAIERGMTAGKLHPRQVPGRARPPELQAPRPRGPGPGLTPRQ